MSGQGIWSLADCAAQVGGRLTGADAVFDGVVTDSRGSCHGQLFVALRGERFDGHDYVANAAGNGAAAAMVEHPVECDLPQWLVPDTLAGLGRLAAAWRDRIPARIVAITGSNGKTTVKEMVAAILSRAGRTRATQGNLNNHIGMPLTLLAARDEDFLILEMGANHHGEIAYMTRIARPEAAMITNAGRAHLEGFGTVAGVARAKGEIAAGLPADGTFVFMADTPWTPLWHVLACGRRALTFGTGPQARVRADDEAIELVWDESGFRTRFEADADGRPLTIELALAGRHNVRNALAAIAMARALDVSDQAICDGLADLVPVRRRLQPRRTAGGVRLIDDSYNANPDSLAAAVDVLVGLAGRRVLVLGDFGELGADSSGLHFAMGEAARAAGVDRLYAVGPLAAHAAAGFGNGARHFADQQALLEALRADLDADDVLLVKGSRASAMDKVADVLCAGAAGEGV
jgi:UDP-N-acetylmuramoyl-tripeptide--D-alanyl-D-alanine ligase